MEAQQQQQQQQQQLAYLQIEAERAAQLQLEKMVNVQPEPIEAAAETAHVGVTTVQVASSAGDGTSYAVTRLPTGELVCECPGFRYRHRCRHLKIAAEMLDGK